MVTFARSAHLASLLFSAVLYASQVSPSHVDAQLRRAPLVATVEITRVEGRAHATWERVTRSRARVRTIQAIRDDGGWFPRVEDEIEIETIGGEWGELGLWVDGYPRPRVGTVYRAHLNRLEDRVFSPAALEFGLIPVNARKAYTRNRTDGSNGDGTGAFLFWDKTALPVPYYISQPTLYGHPDYLAAIDASFVTWKTPADVRLDFVPMGCASVSQNQNDGINAVILVTQNWPFDPANIATTRNFYVAGNSARAGMILDSDIMLNGVDHAFTTTNELGKHDVQNIVTHEAGHFIGLGHDLNPPDPEATMYAVASPNEFKKRDLAADDLAALHASYAGVGPRIALNTSSPGCSLSTAGSSCSAAHRPRNRPGAGTTFAIGFVFLLLTSARCCYPQLRNTRLASAPDNC